MTHTTTDDFLALALDGLQARYDALETQLNALRQIFEAQGYRSSTPARKNAPRAASAPARAIPQATLDGHDTGKSRKSLEWTPEMKAKAEARARSQWTPKARAAAAERMRKMWTTGRIGASKTKKR